MTEAEVRFIKRLPDQLARARQRVLDLENTARRYRMYDLLRDPEHTNRAWDKAICEARLKAGDADLKSDSGER